MELTKRFEHLVTLVENEMLDIFQVEASVASEGEDASRGADDDVRAILLQRILILLDGHSTEENAEK